MRLETWSRALSTLASRFDDDRVGLDQSMFNAARIVRIPGTINRKGDSLPDRPHRLTRIITVPGKLEPVSREQLEALAALARPASQRRAPAGNPGGNFLDQFVAQYSIEVVRIEPWKGGRRLILVHCIFDDTHTGTSAALLERADGALGYNRQHDSCASRSTWAAVRAHYEPGYQASAHFWAKIEAAATLSPMEYETQRRALAAELEIRLRKLDEVVERIRTGEGVESFVHSYGEGPSPMSAGGSGCTNDRTEGGDRTNGDVLFERARSLIEADDPLELVREALRTGGYVGDTAPGELAYVSVSSRFLSRPLNLYGQGPSGSGKNYSVDSGVQLHPPEAYYRLSASSPRALVYTNESFEHRIVVLHEKDSLPEEGPAASAVRDRQ